MCMTLVPLLPIILVAAASQAPAFPVPSRIAVASTPEQTAIIRQGIALHEQGKYDDAIVRYQAALDLNPDNVLALYEMAFAYFEKRDFKKALELSQRGAEYKSEHLLAFYYTIGNSMDQAGDPAGAIEAYKAGLAFVSDARSTAMLHYNMGVTYFTSLKNPADAKAAFQRSASINPSHSSTHILLGQLYHANGYRTPAFFALARFLVLEPASQRSIGAYGVWRQVLDGAVAQKADGTLEMKLNPSPKTDEGDFTQFDVFLGLSKVQEMNDRREGKSAAEAFVRQIDSLFGMVKKGTENASGFTSTYYAPYFAELRERGYVEPFAYYVSQRSSMPGVREWLESHRAEVQAFLQWSAGYPWPKAAQRP
jgi:tetratricopeptide (TPR) repeat protein